ncbi:MAG: tetratricopeptide repeat protein [Bacteroidia bacterium]
MKKIMMILILQTAVLIGQAQTDSVAVFSKSYTAEGNKDYAKAIELLNGIYNQNSYPVNLRMGWLWYLKGDYAKSQVYYKTAIAIEPKSIEARLGYAFPTSVLENWAEVINIYNEILSIDPENSFVNYKQAYISYYIMKDYKKALTFVNKVTRLFPFDFDANYLTAQIQLSMGNIKEAKSAIQYALQYNPQSKEAQKLYESLR